MTKKEEVEQLWDKYNSYKETAEQHMFQYLIIFDVALIPAYNDLKENWDDEHADKFIKGMEQIVFPKLGIG